jgi:dihydroorotate dehydrogenase
MSWFYRGLIRPAFFRQDPEEVHTMTMRWLKRASSHPLLLEMTREVCGAPELPVDLFGLHFPNPVGLAAGMDKSAEAVPAWAALGFGHAELGAATWHAQPGNPKPRIFRAPAAEAIVNRMGFNNPGAEAIADELGHWHASGRWPKHPVGVNLGKSKITPLESAPEDYASSFRALWPYADFFVVNVSSPNTPNLRQLQDKSALSDILTAMHAVNAEMVRDGSSVPAARNHASHAPRPTPQAKPILVKVAPDLTFDALDEILSLAAERNVAGLVATNTTISRPESENPRVREVYTQTGGLSGKPVRERSTEVIRHLYRQSKGKVPIIGVGGIFNVADAWEKITAGASLIQLYTGFIYEGPTLPKQIVRGLAQKLAENGMQKVSDAVGIHAR